MVGLAPGRAAAAVYRYVDWTVADVAAGTASGTITLPDASVVTVTFAATTPTGAAGNLYGAQTVSGAGNNYWLPDAPYVSTQVENRLRRRISFSCRAATTRSTRSRCRSRSRTP